MIVGRGEPSSLQGKRVLVTRAAGQTEGPESLLRARGAVPVVIPSIVIGPPDDIGRLRSAIRDRADVDWVLFTSANGVEHTWRALLDEGRGADAFGTARFAVVGAGTGDALSRHGKKADVLAREFQGEGLARALLDAMGATASGARVRLFRAQEASEVLPGALRRAGVHVEVVPAYRTRPSHEGARQIRARLEEATLDVVVFSSGSTVDSIADGLGSRAAENLGRVTVACIGPVTRDAARARGLPVHVVSKTATFAAVIEVLEEHFRAI